MATFHDEDDICLFCRGIRIYVPRSTPHPPPPTTTTTKKEEKKRKKDKKKRQDFTDRVPELSAAGGPGVGTAAASVVGRRGHAAGRDGQARAVYEGGHVRPDDHGHGLEEAEGRPADRGRLRLQRLGR